MVLSRIIIFSLTHTDVRILTTPGLLMNRNYPSGLLCVWRVECKQEQKIYFNASTHSTQGEWCHKGVREGMNCARGEMSGCEGRVRGVREG